MNIKPIALASCLLALTPTAQLGASLAVAGLSVTLPSSAEAGSTRNERLQDRLDRRQERLENRIERGDMREAAREERKLTRGTRDIEFGNPTEQPDGNRPPTNPN